MNGALKLQQKMRAAMLRVRIRNVEIKRTHSCIPNLMAEIMWTSCRLPGHEESTVDVLMFYLVGYIPGIGKDTCQVP